MIFDIACYKSILSGRIFDLACSESRVLNLSLGPNRESSHVSLIASFYCLGLLCAAKLDKAAQSKVVRMQGASWAKLVGCSDVAQRIDKQVNVANCDASLTRDPLEWPVVDAMVRRAALKGLKPLFDDYAPARCGEIAAALIDGQPDAFWSAIAAEGGKSENLCDLWSRVCGSFAKWNMRGVHSRSIAACLVAGFVRTGLPLYAVFETTTIPVTVPATLSVAVMTSPHLAHALLDLPLECGLDVNSSANGCAPAIGYTNSDSFQSPELFARLLNRTDRSFVSEGVVNIDCGRRQIARATTHVLVSNIFLCTHITRYWRRMATQLALIFIAHAQPDGSGTDLTGGIAQPSAFGMAVGMENEEPTLNQLWPESKFRGPLVLIDSLRDWWCTQEPRGRHMLAHLDPVRTHLVDALRRVRAYRDSLFACVSKPLCTAAMHSRELHFLVTSYVLVPLHDETQLQHPLVSSPSTQSSVISLAPVVPL